MQIRWDKAGSDIWYYMQIIIKVNEFASSLKDDSIEFPLNDMSMELISDLVTTKFERESDKLTVERLEKEIIRLGGNNINQINN